MIKREDWTSVEVMSVDNGPFRGQSATNFQVFISDPLQLNFLVFELWLRGFREEQVATYR